MIMNHPVASKQCADSGQEGIDNGIEAAALESGNRNQTNPIVHFSPLFIKLLSRHMIT